MPSEGPVVSFCERVTPQEYKEQSLITSQRSLKDLLNRIVEDEGLSAKDRKKQLKQVSCPQFRSYLLSPKVISDTRRFPASFVKSRTST